MPNGAQFTNIAAGYKGPWVDQLLTALGAPTTDSNRAALRAWAASEGTVASNNPLAISGSGWNGVSGCIAQCGSGSPISSFNNMTNGVNATASFLQGSYYTNVVSALKNDAGLSAIYQAIHASPWCSGCQSGQYPLALYDATYGPYVTTGNIGSNAAPASTAPAPVLAFGHDPSQCAIPLPVGGCLLNYGQLRALLGGALMVAGGLALVVGLGIVLANGLPKSNPLAKAAPTRVAAQVVRQRRQKRQTASQDELRTRRAEEAAARRRYAQGAGSKPRSRPMDERPFEESDRTLKKAS